MHSCITPCALSYRYHPVSSAGKALQILGRFCPRRVWGGHPASPLQGSSFQLVLPPGNEIKISKPQPSCCLQLHSDIKDPAAIPPFLSFPVPGSASSPYEKVRPGTSNTLSYCWPSPQQGCFPCPHFQDFLCPQVAECTLLEEVLRNQTNLNQKPENQLKISNHSL